MANSCVNYEDSRERKIDIHCLATDSSPPPQCFAQTAEDGFSVGENDSLPADLAAFVLFFQPTHERFEVIHHRARGDVFAGRFF
jgi:hypothetical protein